MLQHRVGVLHRNQRVAAGPQRTYGMGFAGEHGVDNLTRVRTASRTSPKCSTGRALKRGSRSRRRLPRGAELGPLGGRLQQRPAPQLDGRQQPRRLRLADTGHAAQRVP